MDKRETPVLARWHAAMEWFRAVQSQVSREHLLHGDGLPSADTMLQAEAVRLEVAAARESLLLATTGLRGVASTAREQGGVHAPSGKNTVDVDCDADLRFWERYFRATRNRICFAVENVRNRPEDVRRWLSEHPSSSLGLHMGPARGHGRMGGTRYVSR